MQGDRLFPTVAADDLAAEMEEVVLALVARIEKEGLSRMEMVGALGLLLTRQLGGVERSGKEEPLLVAWVREYSSFLLGRFGGFG